MEFELKDLPVRVEIDIKKLLQDRYNQTVEQLSRTKEGYDESYVHIRDGVAINTSVKHGYSYGHYEKDDKYYKEDITDTLDKDLVKKVSALQEIIDSFDW